MLVVHWRSLLDSSISTRPANKLRLGNDWEHRCDMLEVPVDEILDYTSFDALWTPMTIALVFVLGQVVMLVNLDEPFARTTHAPGLMVTEVKRVHGGHC